MITGKRNTAPDDHSPGSQDSNFHLSLSPVAVQENAYHNKLDPLAKEFYYQGRKIHTKPFTDKKVKRESLKVNPKVDKKDLCIVSTGELSAYINDTQWNKYSCATSNSKAFRKSINRPPLPGEELDLPELLHDEANLTGVNSTDTQHLKNDSIFTQ